MPDARVARRLNRAYWDSLAVVHGSDASVDDEAVVAGRDTIADHDGAGIREAVGAVAGLDVLHVQCHIGHDTISLARRGARVTGVDFSSASLEKARQLARRSEVEADFVQADATALPPGLHNRFDLAYATFGVLVWIDDVAAWMRSIAAALRPGGRLLLVDLHPLVHMLDPTVPPETIQFHHGLGEIVTAAVQAGLRIERLEEHFDVERAPRGDTAEPEDDGRFRLRVDGQLLPAAFTLVARRP
jgi:SAM-dependent methyltransferase